MLNSEQEKEQAIEAFSLFFMTVFAGSVFCRAGLAASPSHLKRAYICTHDAGCNTVQNKPGLPAIIRYLVCVLKVS